MTYTRIKTINGRSYKFLVAGKRIEGKVQQKVVKYLGPINPIYKIGKKRAKTNASVYARTLTEQEKTELNKATKSSIAFVRDRAKIILMSSQRLFAKQIANNDEIKKKITLMHFSKTPMSFGYHFTTWTLPRFAKHLIDYKVVDSISIEKVRQILDEAGARLKRSKRWQYSPDKDFYKKNLQ